MSVERKWRVVRQRRRIGHPYWLQFGFVGVREDWRYGGLKDHWVTEYEEDYATLDAAKKALSQRAKQQSTHRHNGGSQ